MGPALGDVTRAPMSEFFELVCTFAASSPPAEKVCRVEKQDTDKVEYGYLPRDEHRLVTKSSHTLIRVGYSRKWTERADRAVENYFLSLRGRLVTP